MTPNAQARQLYQEYGTYRCDALRPTTCVHRILLGELEQIVAGSRGLVRMEELGASLEGRSINLLRVGTGPKTILCWSQMHGDETTATMALCDILQFLSACGRERSWVATMLEQVTIAMIPMLNPDGAEAGRRVTAAQVDVNRDAKALLTPEGRILRETHRALRPAFGFNLHDQEVRSVGSTKKVAALALLAPSPDEKRSRPISRLRAMRVCALISRALAPFADGHIATFTDGYESRSFGDRMQSWGTSTILIESGHWPNDREKNEIRKLNFVALLVAMRGIAGGTYQDAELEHYHALKPNGTSVLDVIIRNVHLTHPSGWSMRADIGLSLEPETNRCSATPVARIVEVGDLHTYGALQMIEGSARHLAHTEVTVGRTIPLSGLHDLLQLYDGG
jgi:hypothetical protein